MKNPMTPRRNRILIFLPLMATLIGATGCMKPQTQTLHYLDKNSPSKYMEKQKARELQPHKTLAGKDDKDWALFLEKQKPGEFTTSKNKFIESEKNRTFYLAEAEKATARGKDYAAITHLQAALELDPEDFTALEKMGLAHLRNNDDDDAEKAFLKAISIETDAPQSYNGLGIINDNQGLHETAEGFYRLAIQMDPDNPRYLNNQGFSLLLAEDIDQAVWFFKEAIKRDPGFSQAYNNLGLAYGMQGNYNKAVEAFKIATDEAGAYNNLGYLYHKEGKRTQAIASFQRAVETNPVWYSKAAENLDSITGAPVHAPNPSILP